MKKNYILRKRRKSSINLESQNSPKLVPPWLPVRRYINRRHDRHHIITLLHSQIVSRSSAVFQHGKTAPVLLTERYLFTHYIVLSLVLNCIYLYYLSSWR